MRKIMMLATVATVLPLAVALADPMAKADATFVKKAAIGGMTEIAEAQAALSTATMPDVKTYAQKMIDDHTANDKELAALVSSKGGAVPTDLDKTHSKQVDALTKKTGTEFDKLYLNDQVNDHEAMAKVMQKEIDDGKDPDLKAFATKTLPTVQDHLNMAKAIKTDKTAS